MVVLGEKERKKVGGFERWAVYNGRPPKKSEAWNLLEGGGNNPNVRVVAGEFTCKECGWRVFN